MQAQNKNPTFQSEHNKLIPFYQNGNMVTAGILSGSSLRKITGHSGEELGNNDELGIKHHATLELRGRCLAELVANIYEGNLTKLDSAADWPESDLDKVKGTKKFLLGGGIANNNDIMGIIVNIAKQVLKEKSLNDIEFVLVPERNASLAAASSVPIESLLQTAHIGR